MSYYGAKLLEKGVEEMAHLFWVTLSKINGTPDEIQELVSYLLDSKLIEKIKNLNETNQIVCLYVQVSNKNLFKAEMKRMKKEKNSIVKNFVYDGLIGKAAPSSKEGRQLSAGVKKFKAAKRDR